MGNDRDIRSIIGRDRSLIGMVHAGALPGAPRARHSVDRLCELALADARVLCEAGFDAIILENMHDVPYVRADRLGHETVACMTRLAAEIRREIPIPLGVQVLSGGNRQALAVAAAAGARFIRCENFVFAHVADEGLLAEAEAGPLLRERRRIDADHVSILCDIRKKHASHAITADVAIDEAARAAEFFGADGLIVTGVATGREADPDDLAAVRGASSLPLLVGSGVTPERLGALFEHADAAIVGSWIKVDGRWSSPIDPGRCAELVRAADRLRA